MRRRSKFNNQPVDFDGYHFDSGFEYDRYRELLLLRIAHDISDLKVHPRFELQPGFRKDGIYIRPIFYEADFQYQDADGAVIVEDVKGFETATWKLKEKMFWYRYPGTTLRVIK